MSIAAIMRRRDFLGGCLLLALASLAMTGCEAQRRTSPPVGATPAAAGNPIDEAAVDLKTVSKADFEQIVASHKGKVVLVDFWATWCGPCVSQFPHTVELSHKYKDKGLDVISVSVDELKEIDAVRTFLASKGADFENLITRYGLNAITEFDVDSGAVPCYWLYDRDGHLAVRISPADSTIKFTPQVIDDAVERLLAAAPSETAPPSTDPAPEPDAVAPADAIAPADAAAPTDAAAPADAAKPEDPEPNP